MGYALNRRQWLKKSTLAVAGLMAGPSWEACRKEASIPQKDWENDDSILLNNNESPFGISPNVLKAITGSIDSSNRYPHGYYSRLIDLIS